MRSIWVISGMALLTILLPKGAFSPGTLVFSLLQGGRGVRQGLKIQLSCG